jgi:hypothetical protein
MALDFQQVQSQVKQLGEQAPQRAQVLAKKRQRALERLEQIANQAEELRTLVQRIVQQHDPSLRCALPVMQADGSSEPLNASHPLPAVAPILVLAADGSQIEMDRHAQVPYCLVNVGAFQMHSLAPERPVTHVQCQLFYDEQLYTITEANLALQRDLRERALLADIAERLAGPIVAFTDGPIELWGGKASGEEASTYQKSLRDHLENMSRLHRRGVIAAGYVDKPGADLLVRLIEISLAKPDQYPHIRNFRELQGVTDRDIFFHLLEPGERSTVFAMQSQSAHNYQGELALHFFYLNVGKPGRPWLARVEIPAWVAHDAHQLDVLHGVLVEQCRILGERPYPYALHRAHEVAVVSLDERKQVSEMIALELLRRGIEVGPGSHKQAMKDSAGRTRYWR